MTARNKTIRERHRAVIRRTKPHCGICLEPIDYFLPFNDPLSFVVDHIHPLSRGGSDELDNKQAAHRSCNRTKGAKLVEEMGPREFVTWRDW